MGSNLFPGFERLTGSQQQTVLDFMWLCAQAGDEASNVPLHRLQAMLRDESTGLEEIDAFLKLANARLREALGTVPEPRCARRNADLPR